MPGWILHLYRRRRYLRVPTRRHILLRPILLLLLLLNRRRRPSHRHPNTSSTLRHAIPLLHLRLCMSLLLLLLYVPLRHPIPRNLPRCIQRDIQIPRTRRPSLHLRHRMAMSLLRPINTTHTSRRSCDWLRAWTPPRSNPRISLPTNRSLQHRHPILVLT